MEVEKNVSLCHHIAKEIHAFSLRPLPWNDGNEQEIDERTVSRYAKMHQWLNDCGHSKSKTFNNPTTDSILPDESMFTQI